MVHGGMDGFDWLQNFLPVDSQPDHGHDPISDNEAHETHPAFNDVEEVAKAAVMHQQAQKTYMFMRSTYPRTNHALDHPQAYSQASGEQYGGNKHQRNSNIQSNSPPNGPSEYQTDRSRKITERPNPSAPSQQVLAAQAYQDAHRRGQIPIHPVRPPERPNSRAVSTSRSPYQGYSATPNQNSQILTQPYITQGITAQAQRTAASQSPSYTHSTILPHRLPYSTPDMPPVQGTHTPVTRPRESWSPYESHSTIPRNAQGSSHQNAPRSSHSMNAEVDTALVSPNGFKTSAAPNTLESRHSTTPATSTWEASNPSAQGPSTNSARSNPISALPSFRNQDHVQSAVPTAPDRVRSPATSQPVSSRSPSVSLVSSGPAPPALPTQKTIVQYYMDKGWREGKEKIHGKSAPTSSYQASNQTSQQPLISQQNEQSRPVVSSALASFTPPVASHTGQNPSHTSGPRRGTFSDSPVAQQPAARNAQSRGYPPPIPPPHQQKRWAPSQDHLHGSMPPAKMRRLDNGGSQTKTPRNDQAAGNSVPGAQVPMVHARPRGLDTTRDKLAQPMKQSDLLQKQSYNPATIARDVLISAGKHPTEKRLNHHLEALRRNYLVDMFADLTTFRWDLVDVKPQFGRKSPVSAPQMPFLRQPPGLEPLQADQQLLPRATPNHVVSRDHAQLPSRDTPPNRQDPTPGRIDARAPTGGLGLRGTSASKAPTYHSPYYFSSKFPSGPPRIDPVSASPNSSPRKSVPSPAPTSQPQPQPPSQQRRPSTTKSTAPPRSPQPQPQTQTQTQPSSPPPPPPPQQRRPLTTKSAAPRKSPLATKQATPQSKTKPTPQGQTVKSQSDSDWTVKSPEARRPPQPQVVVPPSPAKMAPKRRPGRPPKSLANNVEVAIPREQPVRYQIFPCKWEECIAELHNIDSVRAHLAKVHIPHSLVCRWEDCGNKTPMAAADMFKHLASEHISKMAWALGDGPKVPVTAENQSNHPSVLGDRSARQGTMVLPVEQIAVKAFSKAHGKSTLKTKAEALLEAGRHWKQQIGPEMDWSDRRLSTPTRQKYVNCGEMAFIAND